MTAGYVYVMSNPSMPGLLKVGMTTRSVEARAAELHTSGVPTPFEIEHVTFSPDPAGLEAHVHSLMPDFRVSGCREFFRADLDLVVDLIRGHLREQVDDFVSRFLPDMIIADPVYTLDVSEVGEVAEKTGLIPAEAIDALKLINLDEMNTLAARYRDRVKAISQVFSEAESCG